MPTPNPKNLYRILGHCNGWDVCIIRNGKVSRRFFSDSLHNGNRGAKKAAIAFRDEIRSSMPVNYKNRITKRSTTGVVGVVDMGTAYRGTWYDGKKRCSQSFNKAIYGNDKALRLASMVHSLGHRIDPKSFLE